jgi:hypothetical protein
MLNPLPEHRRRSALPRLPLIDDSFVCGANQLRNWRLRKPQAATDGSQDLKSAMRAQFGERLDCQMRIALKNRWEPVPLARVHPVPLLYLLSVRLRMLPTCENGQFGLLWLESADPSKLSLSEARIRSCDFPRLPARAPQRGNRMPSSFETTSSKAFSISGRRRASSAGRSFLHRGAVVARRRKRRSPSRNHACASDQFFNPPPEQW